MDFLTPEDRSFAMSRVRSADTTPEMVVRKAIWRRGRRFRLHPRELPGRPDIVLPRFRLAIFVHGCFWHRHAGCRKATTPKSNVSFWMEKFAANVARDRRKESELIRLGWRVATIWECETSPAFALETVLDRIIPLANGDAATDGHLPPVETS